MSAVPSAGTLLLRAHTGHCHEVFSAMQPFLPAIGQICVTPLASKDAGEEAEVTGHLPCGGGWHSLSSLKESAEEKNVSRVSQPRIQTSS